MTGGRGRERPDERKKKKKRGKAPLSWCARLRGGGCSWPGAGSSSQALARSPRAPKISDPAALCVPFTLPSSLGNSRGGSRQSPGRHVAPPFPWRGNDEQSPANRRPEEAETAAARTLKTFPESSVALQMLTAFGERSGRGGCSPNRCRALLSKSSQGRGASSSRGHVHRSPALLVSWDGTPHSFPNRLLERNGQKGNCWLGFLWWGQCPKSLFV